jgi:3-hydroxyisobutyrate dehydrogenase-like beta-hydroxyacid dehydrogenase
MMNQRIGMVGIGMMGHGIATNILKGGYSLAVLEHSGNQPLDALKDAGATTYTSAAALAANSDVVILCVTGSPQVESALLSEGGILEGLRENAIVIDCSTAIPSSTLSIAATVKSKGGRFLDAPMTRTPKEAAEGRLNLLVGGDVDLFNEVRPLLRTFAENVTHAGGIGAGHRMKLLHNFVSLGFIALLSEAAACAIKAGIDADVFVDILAKGGGGGVALERMKPYLLSRDTSAVRFAMSNAAKDLTYYSSMVEEMHVASTIAEAVRGTYATAASIAPERMAPELTTMLGEDSFSPRHTA